MAAFRESPPETVEGFLEGPCARFIEFASDADLTTRATARILEFLRQSVLEMQSLLIGVGAIKGDTLLRSVKSSLADALSDRQDWLKLEQVIDGKASHNSL